MNESTQRLDLVGAGLEAPPAGQRALTLEQRFQQLRRLWKEETLFSSSITEIAMHPA